MTDDESPTEESTPIEVADGYYAKRSEILPALNNPAFFPDGAATFDLDEPKPGGGRLGYFLNAAQNRAAFEDAELALCPAAIRAGRKPWTARRKVSGWK